MTDEKVPSRRLFLKRGLSKVTQFGSEVVEQKVSQKAKAWIRPPFAIAELDFLLACTRCDACISACPYDVVFPLPASRGLEVADTPALDIMNKGCHLCSDWPCVTACETKALNFAYGKITKDEDEQDNNSLSKALNDEQNKQHNSEHNGVPSNEYVGRDGETETIQQEMPTAIACPPMAKAMINTGQCMPYSGPECGACKGSCPIPDTLVWKNEKPSIVQSSCIGCGMCREACITSPKAIDISSF